MDIGRAVSYVFADPAWLRKTLIGAALLLIPILGVIVVYGYFLRTLRLVADGHDHLPVWEDFGDLFVAGLKGLGVILVWAIPFWLLLCPILIVTGALDEAAGGPFLLDGLATPAALLFTFITAPAISRLATTGSFAAGLDVAAVFAMLRSNLGEWLVAAVVGWVALLVAGLGIILLFVGVLYTFVLAYLINAHLYGQAFRRTLDTSPPPAPPRF